MACLCLAGLTLGLLTGPAAAAEGMKGEISSVAPVQDGLVVSFRATDLPVEATLDDSSLQVSVNGRPVTASAHALEDEAAPTTSRRRVALVIDTSGSMAGAPLEAARAAANAYLAAVPTDVEVALVAFAGTTQDAVPPTRDRAQVAAALSRLQASGGTSLYDAVIAASKVLGTEGQRRILVLSDGEDSSSAASLDQAVSAVSAGTLGLDAVALGQSSPAIIALTRLSAVGRGQLLRAGDDVEAVAAFEQVARAFAPGLQLRVKVPQTMPGGSATLDVQVRTNTGDVVRGVSPVVLPEPPAAEGVLSTRAGLVAGMMAVFVGLAAALVLAVSWGDTQAVGRRRTEQVLATYTLRGRADPGAAEPSSRIGSGALAVGALSVAESVLGHGQRKQRLEVRLERAAVRFTAREWLVLQALISLGAFLLVVLVGSLPVALLAALIAASLVHLWLSVKGGRRASSFEAQMPDALQMVASGLSTGYSLPQALDSVVNDGQPPLAEELGRALAEARLGAPLEKALDNVADRMSSNDFRWVVMAIRVQREVGGNLSEVLSTVCQTMRERNALKRQIKALSAEGRLGAVILIAMPFFIVAYLSLINPDFFRPMWETTLGNVLLGGCVLALGAGALWMKQLVKVEA